MFKSVNYVTISTGDDTSTIELYDKYPSWYPYRQCLLRDVDISICGPGISVKGRRINKESGTYYTGHFCEIKNPEKFEEGDCEKTTVKKWNGWFGWDEREAYFATKSWITEKVKPKFELNTSVYKIIDERQK
tara:strand:- start:2975 stop:3370 length:396 start_codon:yes stop_codon:yes gene_type:complete